MKNNIEKTNYDYLKEFLKGNDEGLEFLEAMVKQDNDRTKELQSEIEDYKYKITQFESELTWLYYPSKIYDNQIDFGIGILEYKEPDNLNLQIFMEELRSKHEHNANFNQLKLAV